MSKGNHSIELFFNDEDRISYEGNLNFDPKSFQFNFSVDEIEILQNDCKTAFTSRAEKKGYSTGETFFLRADENPMCILEQLAQSIFRKHTENALFDGRRSGCEWWTLVLDAEDDVGFHFDRDYGLESDYNTFVHPHIATVTYLSDVGASTIVLNAISSLGGQSSVALQNTEVTLCQPSTGKHFCFDGKLLHGAPTDMMCNAARSAQSENKRITFLVNIWLNHIPINSTRIPRKYLKLLNSSLSLNTAITTNEETTNIACDGVAVDDILTWKFPNGSSFHSLTMPKPATLKNTLNGSSTIRIVYGENTIKICKISSKKRKR